MGKVVRRMFHSLCCAVHRAGRPTFEADWPTDVTDPLCLNSPHVVVQVVYSLPLYLTVYCKLIIRPQ